ncbi:MAG: type II toxin-antitoxin system VapC family toxin [Planctomycetota bacterium]
MQYLLDTNAWIIYLKDPNSSIRAKLASISPQQVVTCSVVLSELLHGAEKYGNRLQRLNIIKSLLAPFPCVPFDEVDATYYATIRHDLELQGHRLLGPMIYKLPQSVFAMALFSSQTMYRNFQESQD